VSAKNWTSNCLRTSTSRSSPLRAVHSPNEFVRVSQHSMAGWGVSRAPAGRSGVRPSRWRGLSLLCLLGHGISAQARMEISLTSSLRTASIGKVPSSFRWVAQSRRYHDTTLRWSAWVAMAGAVLVGLTVPATSLASKSAPRIVRAGASTNNDEPESAEVIIVIRTGELETKYEVWLENEGTASEVAEGEIPPSRLEKEMTIKLSHLLPDHTYGLAVFASNSDGSVGVGSSFTTFPPLPPGCPTGCPGAPVEYHPEPPISQEEIENARRDGEGAPAREAERQAKKREEEERAARQAAAQAAKEREIREAGERAGREAAERDRLATLAMRCIVPRLKGDSLATARKALRRAHCALGKVSKTARVGHLVVATQGIPAGRKLGKGTKVSVTLIVISNRPTRA
jgi:hypothetical protein